MYAALVTGKREIRQVAFPEPEATPGRAVVAVDYCGICGTDLHAWLSGEPYNPAICGHEWSGQVMAVGDDVSHVHEGDRVAVGVATPCGTCRTCQRGDAGHCETVFAGMIGVGPMAAAHGGFAPAIAIEAARLYQLENGIDPATAALLEPATVAVHAVRRTPIRLGDSVVVLGGGPIGLLTLQCARVAGAGTVILVEPQPARRQLGQRLGADRVIDPRAENVAEAVDAWLGQSGADVVFECAGIPATINQSVTLARRGGVVSLVGVADQQAQIVPAEWLIKEVELVASLGYLREEFAVAQGLVLDGRLDLPTLHTSTVALDDIAQAFERLTEAPEEVKILVNPRQ